jgi:TRAP-type transport system periplasmic protein
MKSFAIRCAIFVTVAMVFSLSLPVWAQEKVVKLRYSNFFPPVHPTSKLSEEWISEIDKRTSGRVKISYFAGGTLTPPGQTYDSVIKGIADIGQSLTSYSPGRFPLMELTGLPLGFTNGYQATKLANEYYKKFKPKEFDETKLMYLHSPSPGIIHTKKVVGSIDEIKGLRIKTNADVADIVSALGGAPVTMPITETYDAISKGLLDGAFIPLEALKGWRFAEVLKCTIENYALAPSPAFFVVMNLDKWNSISKEDQQIIEKINEEWIEKQALLWIEVDKEAREFALQKGVKFVKASKNEEVQTSEKMKPILSKWVSTMKGKVPSEEALKFCQDWLLAHP